MKEVSLKGKGEENGIGDHFAHHSADHPGHRFIHLADERWVDAALVVFLPNRYTRTNEELLSKNLLSAHAVDEHTRGI